MIFKINENAFILNPFRFCEHFKLNWGSLPLLDLFAQFAKSNKVFIIIDNSVSNSIL